MTVLDAGTLALTVAVVVSFVTVAVRRRVDESKRSATNRRASGSGRPFDRRNP